MLIAAIIIFSFFRLINLQIIPVFADEAIYIHWAQIAWHNHTQRFIALTDGKPPLHTWLMIPFLKIIKDPLIAGRLLSIFAGFAVFMGLFLIIRKLFNQQMAVLGLLLTAICPFLIFYDRLAVADSLLTAFGVWSFYLSLLLLEKPDLGKAFLLGFCWGGGVLTKQPALYFIALAPLEPLLIKKLNLKQWKKLIFYSIFSLIVAFVSYNVVKFSPFSHLLSVRSYDYILGKREFIKHPFQLFWGNLKAIIPWTYSYQTLIPTIFFFIGLGLLVKNSWRKALVFSSWLLVPIIGSAAIGKIIFPRYFVFIEPWIIIFIAYGLISLKKLPFVFYPLFFTLCFPWFYFSLMIVFKPTKAPLIRREQDQYLTTWASGYGIKEAALWLRNHYPQEKVFVATEGYFGTLPDGLQIYLDGFNNIEVYGIGQPISEIPQETFEKAKQSPTFLVVNDSRFYNSGEALELINSYPKPEFPFLKESLLFFKVKAE